MIQTASSRVRPRTWQLVVTFGLAQIISLGLLLGPLLGQPWYDGFRRYFANDQLSYAAIASNVAGGELGLVEPFTQTATSFYPSLWYQLMGLLASATYLPVYLLWTVMGLVIVGVAVGVVGWLALRVSGRAYAPLLPGLALLTGTLSILRADDWFTPISSHAVLWGPYGTLFTLNAEVAGLSLTAVAISLLVFAVQPLVGVEWSRRRRSAGVLFAAAIVGLLANVQTYSFFTAVSLSALFVASRALLISRSGRAATATAVLLIAVLAAGTPIAGVIGPLPTFALLLVALLPASWSTLRRNPRLTAAALAVFVLAAAPQVVRTLLGLAADDPFLTYRQASTVNLDVPVVAAVMGALPLLLAGAFCATSLWRRGQPTLGALLIALGAGAAIMSANDRWGFSQEPYRFWLQYAVLAALLLTPVLAWSLSTRSDRPRATRRAILSLAIAAAIIWTLSLRDLPAFWQFARTQGVMSADDDRAQAVRTILGDHDGLVMSSACLDPGMLKLISPGPVAFYNAGLAWPADEPAFKIFQDVPRRASENPVALRAARVQYVLTDSTCATDWTFPADQQVVPLRTQRYLQDGITQTLTLWWVQPS